MSESNTHGQGPNDPHPGTRTTPPAAPRPCEFGADGMCIHHDHWDADGERRVLPRPVSPEAARGDTWRCAAQRSHGVCNSFNDIDEETCGACGADRPEAAPPRATTAEPPITDFELSKITDVGVLRAMVSESVHEVTRLRAPLAAHPATTPPPADFHGILSSPSRESGALLDKLQRRAGERALAEAAHVHRDALANNERREADARAAVARHLASLERDAARMRAIDDDLDDLRWIRPSFHADGPLVELDWFVGDGGGSTLTTGATISEAVDAYLAALPPSGEREPTTTPETSDAPE